MLLEATQCHSGTEAVWRAEELRADLTTRGVHADILRFCRAELVADYFHAVLEATKSIAAAGDRVTLELTLPNDVDLLPITEVVVRGAQAGQMCVEFLNSTRPRLGDSTCFSPESS